MSISKYQQELLDLYISQITKNNDIELLQRVLLYGGNFSQYSDSELKELIEEFKGYYKSCLD
jgi:hypothetical protein